MRRFVDLTDDEQEKAIAQSACDLLTAIVGGIRFDDLLNGDDFQTRIDRACTKANDMQTPWFAHEYIMEDDYCKDIVERMSQADAEDAFYPNVDETVIRI